MDNSNIPNFIKRIEQKELNELYKLLTECNVLPMNLVENILQKRNKKPTQIKAILNQMIKRKLACYDDGQTCLKLNRAFSSSESNMGLVKSLWLLFDIINKVEVYFIQFKAPHTITFLKKGFSNNENTDNVLAYDIFYIPFGSENVNNYMIKNICAEIDKENPINAFMIIDSEEQIKKIQLTENINVISYVLVNPNSGEVSYINVD